MTKNIRKAAPEGAKYFRITGNMVEYAKRSEDGLLVVYNDTAGRWNNCGYGSVLSPSECGFHAFEAPKWIWFAFGGLFGAVIMGLFL